MKTYTLTESELQEMICQAAKYGFDYRDISQHHGEVPRGNVLQWFQSKYSIPSPLLPTEEVGIKEDDYVASDNATMKPRCDAPVIVQNNIEQLVLDGYYAGFNQAHYSHLHPDVCPPKECESAGIEYVKNKKRHIEFVLNKVLNVAVSDTTEADSSNADGNKEEKTCPVCNYPYDSADHHQNCTNHNADGNKRIPSIDWEGLEKEFTEIVIRVEEMYPYKQEGNRDSYSDYNQGWSSACDVLSEKAINFFKTNLQNYIK